MGWSIPSRRACGRGRRGAPRARRDPTAARRHVDEPGDVRRASCGPTSATGSAGSRCLRELGLGGCLADDMGLGKTVMVLAWLDRLRASGVDAARAWSSCRARSCSTGSRRRGASRRRCACSISRTPRVRADTANVPDVHVAISTYGTLRRDLAALAHQRVRVRRCSTRRRSIKNAATASAKAARALRATASPRADGHADREPPRGSLERARLRESGVLAARGGHRAPRVRRPRPSDERDRIARAVRPFILRRTKAQVARDLPPRTEQTITCELGAHERRLYDELRDHYRARAAVGRRRGSARAEGGCRCSRRCCACARRRVIRG